MSALALQELGALSFEPASCGWYPRIEAEALEIFACQLDSSFTCSLGLSKVGSPGGQLALFLDVNMHAKPTCPKLLPSAAWAAAISIQPSTRSMSRGVAARGACHCRNFESWDRLAVYPQLLSQTGTFMLSGDFLTRHMHTGFSNVFKLARHGCLPCLPGPDSVPGCG